MRTWLAAILVACLFVRIVSAWVWQNYNVQENYLRFGDSDSYWYLARTIAHGEPYQYGSANTQIFRAPLYPLFLSPFAAMLPPGESFSWSAIFWARVAGCIAGTMGVAILMFLAARLASLSKSGLGQSGEPNTKTVTCLVAVSSGLLATLYPGAVGMSIFVLSESLFCPLMIAGLAATFFSIVAIERARNTKAIFWMLAAGVLSGAACLSRPSWSLWPVILFPYLAWMIWRSEPVTHNLSWGRFRTWILCCLMFCIGNAVCMSPWWIRNYWVSGTFVPTTLQVGASLYDGWHPGASGSSDENMAFVDQFVKEQLDEDQRQQAAGNGLNGAFESRLDRRMRNAAIDWALENSSAAVQLGLVKFVKTWSPLPVARELGSSAVRWAEAFGYSVIMLLSGVGMWRLRNQSGAWLMAMPAVYFAILHMFFIGSVRYRQPAVLVLCVLGGVGLVCCMQWIVNKFTNGSIKMSMDR
jgi:hypothetical protein